MIVPWPLKHEQISEGYFWNSLLSLILIPSRQILVTALACQESIQGTFCPNPFSGISLAILNPWWFNNLNHGDEHMLPKSYFSLGDMLSLYLYLISTTAFHVSYLLSYYQEHRCHGWSRDRHSNLRSMSWYSSLRWGKSRVYRSIHLKKTQPGSQAQFPDMLEVLYSFWASMSPL